MTRELFTHRVVATVGSTRAYFDVTSENFKKLSRMSPTERDKYLERMADEPDYEGTVTVTEKAKLVRAEGGTIHREDSNQILPGGITAHHELLHVSAAQKITITETANPDGISHLAAEYARGARPGISDIAGGLPNLVAAFLPGLFPKLASENKALTGNPRAPATAEQKAALERTKEFDKNRNSAVKNVIREMINNVIKPITITEVNWHPPSVTARQAYLQDQSRWTEPGGGRTIIVPPKKSSFGRQKTETIAPDCDIPIDTFIQAEKKGESIEQFLYNRQQEEQEEAGISFYRDGHRVA